MILTLYCWHIILLQFIDSIYFLLDAFINFICCHWWFTMLWLYFVSVLGRALHALARIGDELYLEPLNGGLTFRTVHSNHSVYAEVNFTNQFFSYYNCPVQIRNQSDVDDDTDALKCRINMKVLPKISCEIFFSILLRINERMTFCCPCIPGLFISFSFPTMCSETSRNLPITDWTHMAHDKIPLPPWSYSDVQITSHRDWNFAGLYFVIIIGHGMVKIIWHLKQ